MKQKTLQCIIAGAVLFSASQTFAQLEEGLIAYWPLDGDAQDQIADSHGEEMGGLSGEPVKEKSTQVIKLLAKALDNKLPIIGVGGILNGADAKEKIDAGAKLVQVYTGFIYKGPEIIKDVVNAL